MQAEEIRIVPLDDKHIGMILELVVYRWSLTKGVVQKDLQPY